MEHKNAWLAHHGILGQKWGVRRGKNYPLDEDEHSAVEKKAGWKKSLDGKNEDQYDRKKNKSSPKSDKKFNENAKKMLERFDRRDEAYAKLDKEWEKSDKSQKSWDKHLKKEHKLDKQLDKEQNELRKKVFGDARVKSKVESAHKILKDIDSLRDSMIGVNSPAYKKALSEYVKKNGGDDGYGFSHYQWREGNKAYDAAYSEFKNKSKALSDQYNQHIKDISNSILEGLGNEADSKHGNWGATYRDSAQKEINEMLKFRYKDVFG